MKKMIKRTIATIMAASLSLSASPVYAASDYFSVLQEAGKRAVNSGKKDNEADQVSTEDEYYQALLEAKEESTSGKFQSFKNPITKELHELLTTDDDRLLHELELKAGLSEVHYNGIYETSVNYSNSVFDSMDFYAGSMEELYEGLLTYAANGCPNEEIYAECSADFYEELTDSRWQELSSTLAYSFPTGADVASAGMLPVIQIRFKDNTEIKMIAAYRSGDTSGLSAEEARTLEIAKQWAAQAAAGSILQTEQNIHDIICANTVYDDNDINKERQHSCLGVFLDGTAVCSGYAEAFYLLATMSGMECTIQRGLTDGEIKPLFKTNHAWNVVKLDGSWAAVDVTWDDSSNGGWDYEYFNISLDKLKQERTWDYGPETL